MRILFVDDEPFFAAPYVSVLEEAGWTVECAETADEALRKIQSDSEFDVVILDIMMPAPAGLASQVLEDELMTGLFILRKVGSFLSERGVPIVVLTNRARSRVEEALSSIGLPEGLVEIRTKIETPRFYLPRVIQRLADRWMKK